MLHCEWAPERVLTIEERGAGRRELGVGPNQGRACAAPPPVHTVCVAVHTVFVAVHSVCVAPSFPICLTLPSFVIVQHRDRLPPTWISRPLMMFFMQFMSIYVNTIASNIAVRRWDTITNKGALPDVIHGSIGKQHSHNSTRQHTHNSTHCHTYMRTKGAGSRTFASLRLPLWRH